jgi:hypothetical protein
MLTSCPQGTERRIRSSPRAARTRPTAPPCPPPGRSAARSTNRPPQVSRRPGSGRRDGQVKAQRHGRDKRFGVTSGRFRTLSPRARTHRGISYACCFVYRSAVVATRRFSRSCGICAGYGVRAPRRPPRRGRYQPPCPSSTPRAAHPQDSPQSQLTTRSSIPTALPRSSRDWITAETSRSRP